MENRSDHRLRRQAAPARGKVQIFKPRLLPRDTYDVRLVTGVYCLALITVLSLALSWLVLPFVVMQLLHLGTISTLLLLAVQMTVWSWVTLQALVSHVEMADDGLRIVGPRSRTITWDAIEAVEPLGRGETVSAMLCWPLRGWNLQMSGGFTFGSW